MITTSENSSIVRKSLFPKSSSPSSCPSVPSISSRWEFLDAETCASSSFIEVAQATDKEGIGLFSHKHYSLGDTVLMDAATSVVPIGLHSSQRICHKCHKHPLSKIKVPDGFPFVCYCSLDCLKSDSNYLDKFGTSLLVLKKRQPELYDSFYLSTRLHHYTIEDPCAYESMRKLTTYSQRPENEYASKICDLPIFSDRKVRGEEAVCSPKLIEKLMLAVKYNAQQFQIFKLPGTYFLSIFPYLSRLNHSCTPNIVLTYYCAENNIFLGRAIAVKDIEPGDEIVMLTYDSYTIYSNLSL